MSKQSDSASDLSKMWENCIARQRLIDPNVELYITGFSPVNIMTRSRPGPPDEYHETHAAQGSTLERAIVALAKSQRETLTERAKQIAYLLKEDT